MASNDTPISKTTKSQLNFNCIVLVWCRLLLSKPTIYPTLPDVSKWQMSNLQSAENHLARGIRWCWKSSRTHACLQRLHFINIFSVRFAQYNRLQKKFTKFSFFQLGIWKVTLFQKCYIKVWYNLAVSNESFISKGQRSGSHYFIHPFHLLQIVINNFYKLYRVLSALWNCKFLLWKWK